MRDGLARAAVSALWRKKIGRLPLLSLARWGFERNAKCDTCGVH
jgi:hypothetical protein